MDFLGFLGKWKAIEENWKAFEEYKKAFAESRKASWKVERRCRKQKAEGERCSDGLFWRKLRFGVNWLHIIFRQIVLEAAQIWRELVPHYFPTVCFGGSSNLAGTGSTLFSDRLFWRQLTLFLDRIFWRQLKFGGNWLHIIFRQIILEIWRELAPHHFLADCFGGSSDLAGTGSTLFSDRLFWRQLKFGGNWLHIIF